MKHTKKFLSLLAALALVFALSTPALADMGYTPLNTDPEWLAWKDGWIAANPEKWAAFDPDLWFEIHYEYWTEEADFMAYGEIPDRETFEAHMAQGWLEDIKYAEDQYPLAEAYAAAHPEEYAAFDPDAWVERSWYNTREGYMEMWQVDGETFFKHMWNEYAIPAALPEAAQAWAEAHPAEVERFLAEEIEDFAARYSYAPIAATAEDWGTGEDYVRAVVLNLWVDGKLYEEEQQAWLADFEILHPGLLDRFRAEAWTYFGEKYAWWTGSAAQWLEENGLTEEEFAGQMARERAEEFLYREEERRQSGLTPGQIGVLYNAQYIPTQALRPEAVRGRTMAGPQALMEALGGTASYDAEARTVICTLGETVVTLKLGEQVLTVERAGEIATAEMDCAAYERPGGVCVPVRFVAQALGYTVLWDGLTGTAAILDPAV